MNKIALLHVIPSLTIGGVEVGIYRSRVDLIKVLSYQVFCVKNHATLPVPRLGWLDILNCVLRRRNIPDIVVSSLWLGHLVGFLLAIALGTKWVPFFHAARTEGFLRDLILRSAARLSRFAFFDSEATQIYYGTHTKFSSKIIPYRFLCAPSFGQSDGRRHFDCVFVGRLSPEKRSDLLLSYLQQLQRLDSGIKSLIIISTDENGLKLFQNQLHTSGVTADLRANIDPLGVVSLLSQSSLYISFSDYEGFSMATVDAMSCGCVPVVRPVGEISSYVDSQCGILITDTTVDGLKAAAENSYKLLKDAKTLQVLSDRARKNVSRYELYTDAFVDGINRALNQS